MSGEGGQGASRHRPGASRRRFRRAVLLLLARRQTLFALQFDFSPGIQGMRYAALGISFTDAGPKRRARAPPNSDGPACLFESMLSTRSPPINSWLLVSLLLVP